MAGRIVIGDDFPLEGWHPVPSSGRWRWYHPEHQHLTIYRVYIGGPIHGHNYKYRLSSRGNSIHKDWKLWDDMLPILVAHLLTGREDSK